MAQPRKPTCLASKLYPRPTTRPPLDAGYAGMINRLPSGLCPVILCLDISGSMKIAEKPGEAPIDCLVDGLWQFHRTLTEEEGGCPSVTFCILTFQGYYDKLRKLNCPAIDCLKPFDIPLAAWHPPRPGELAPRGTTWIGAALLEAKRRLESWTHAYEQVKGIGASKRARLFLMTDGRTSKGDFPAFEEARQWLHRAIAKRALEFTAIFCCEPDMQDSPVAKEAKVALRSLFPPDSADCDNQPYVYGVDRIAFRDLLLDVSSSSVSGRAFMPTRRGETRP